MRFYEQMLLMLSRHGISRKRHETPREFAMELNDRLADIVIRLATEAKGRGKPLGVLYVKASAANPAGCVPERCRRLVAVADVGLGPGSAVGRNHSRRLR